MSEEYIVRYCAPTLAGLKTGSTFVCPCTDQEALRCDLRSANRKLSPKGLRVLPLRIGETRALCYVYRTDALDRDLRQSEAAELLRERGYPVDSCGKCLARLARKVREEGDFPHEIGLFLGYPPEDVKGFLENGACGHKCVGCWKVYGDAEAAQKRFDQYKHCTSVYLQKYAEGRPLERLTVAS